MDSFRCQYGCLHYEHMYTTSTSSVPQIGMIFYTCVCKLRCFSGSMRIVGNSAVRIQLYTYGYYLFNKYEPQSMSTGTECKVYGE